MAQPGNISVRSSGLGPVPHREAPQPTSPSLAHCFLFVSLSSCRKSQPERTSEITQSNRVISQRRLRGRQGERQGRWRVTLWVAAPIHLSVVPLLL